MLSYFRSGRWLLPALSFALVFTIAACGGGNDGSDEPTPTATPLASDRAPTALATVPPTPTARSSPQATTSATGTPGSSPTVPVSPTPTVISSPGTPQPSPTTGPTPAATEVPSPTSTPAVIESGKELVNEARGVMQLKPGSGRAIEYSPGVDSVDFRVSVEFSNPFHPTFSPWNYGVKFRDDGQKYQMFVLDHNGDLLYIRGDGPELEIVSSMPVPTMFTAGGIRNKMTLLVIADRAYVLVDGILTGIFTVEDTADSGEVSLVTDIYNQTVVVGAQTEFFDLVINSAGLIGSSGPGQLVRSQPGEIAVGEPSLLTSEGYARVTFVSPINAFSGDYSYGLLFRNEVTGIDNWLVFDDSKKWRHIRRSTTGAESVLSSGTASELKTGAGDANSFEFLSTGQENKVYLNGKLLTNLGFAPEDLPFTIAPMAAFEPTHQTGGMATEYRDFAVWSVAR